MSAVPGTTDPFGKAAQRVNQERLITTEAERAARAADIAHLREHGYVVLRDLLDEDELAHLRTSLDEINARTPPSEFEFAGTHTHRAYCVVAQTRAFDALVMHRDVLAVVEGYFGEAPQLGASMGMTIREGQATQPLHRDTGHYGLPWPRPPLEVNSIWAFDDFRESNGATRFVSGSHRIEGEDPPGGTPAVACMSAGSVFVYDGSLWHGGGASTERGGLRRCVNNIYVRQWLRQQDNMYLSIPPEEVLGMPTLMQRLLGYWIYGYTLGVVEGGPPLQALRRRRDACASAMSRYQQE